MHIERHIYPYISRMLRQYKIVLIVGSRQVGKTYLVRNKLLDRYGYTVLDDFTDLEMAKTDPALFFLFPQITQKSIALHIHNPQ